MNLVPFLNQKLSKIRTVLSSNSSYECTLREGKGIVRNKILTSLFGRLTFFSAATVTGAPASTVTGALLIFK